MKTLDVHKIITVGLTEHCLLLKYSGVRLQTRFYLTMTEFESLLQSDNPNAAFTDCGNVLHVGYDGIALYRYAERFGEGETLYAKFKMNSAKFFRTIKKLIDNGVIAPDKQLELCTDSFVTREEPFADLGWAAIVRDRTFRGFTSLKNAMRLGPDSIRSLKRLLSIKLQQGFEVYDDGEHDFYFEFRRGEALSNGGIILNNGTGQYSIHT